MLALVIMLVACSPFVIIIGSSTTYALIRRRWIEQEREFDFHRIAIITAFTTSAMILVFLFLDFSGFAVKALGVLGGLLMLAFALSVLPTFLMSVYDCMVRLKKKY